MSYLVQKISIALLEALGVTLIDLFSYTLLDNINGPVTVLNLFLGLLLCRLRLVERVHDLLRWLLLVDILRVILLRIEWLLVLLLRILLRRLTVAFLVFAAHC